MEASQGQQFGEYRVIRKIGRGGFGTVYLAENALFPGRPFALKVFGDREDNTDVVAPLREELGNVIGLSHPNIVQVRGFGVNTSGDSSQPYIVMDYIEGPNGSSYNLKQYVSACGGKLPPHEVIRIAKQIASALELVHHRRIAHLDLKPQNILLDKEMNAYLTDFGISQAVSSYSMRDATIVSIQGLTPNYASPEQIQHSTGSRHSDVYSLGVMILECLTGKRPEVVHSRTHPRVDYDPPSSMGLDPSWDTFLERCLAVDPGDRYANAGAMLRALDCLEKGLPIPSVTDNSPTPATTPAEMPVPGPITTQQPGDSTVFEDWQATWTSRKLRNEVRKQILIGFCISVVFLVGVYFIYTKMRSSGPMPPPPSPPPTALVIVENPTPTIVTILEEVKPSSTPIPLTSTPTTIPVVIPPATQTPLPTQTLTHTIEPTLFPSETPVPPTITRTPTRIATITETPTIAPTLSPTATATSTPLPSSTNTQLPTETPQPTRVPTESPTETAIPLTDTPIPTSTLPPTATQVPDTATPIPTHTSVFTHTPLPPTHTSVPPTHTLPPPTATPPLPTSTLKPTLTATPIPPTSTQIPKADPTSTWTLVPSPTRTTPPKPTAALPVEISESEAQNLVSAIFAAIQQGDRATFNSLVIDPAADSLWSRATRAAGSWSASGSVGSGNTISVRANFTSSGGTRRTLNFSYYWQVIYQNGWKVQKWETR